MQIYNTLTRRIDEFIPIDPKNVGFYACGLTVNDFTHLGHLRKYTMDDVLIKTLRHAGYLVNFVQNITDVGHLSSDSDTGEDKLEKGSRKYHKTAWEVAKEFEAYFWKSMELMGVDRPDISCRATEHIAEQLEMVKSLEAQGFTYLIEGDGVYFDTSKIDDYGKLALVDIEQLREGARVEMVSGKRLPTDFALWKFERPGENRAMIWESPWHSRSFPGWHIECSAMSVKYLGTQFDIHTGGIDLINIHHTNEIAQTESVSGQKPFVRHWVHYNFLRVEGEKMSKSLGNFLTVDAILARDIHPRALRLLFLTIHYRSEMNFTWPSLEGMQKTYLRLLRQVVQLKHESGRTVLSDDKLRQVDTYRHNFYAALENDLKTTEAVVLIWEMLKSNIPGSDKYELLMDWDEVLGLGLAEAEVTLKQYPSDRVVTVADIAPKAQELFQARLVARQNKDWMTADFIRDQLLAVGYQVKDEADGSQSLLQL